MKPRIVVTADSLKEIDLQTIREAAGEWGDVQRLPQEGPQTRDAVMTADIVIGWAHAEWLRDGKPSVYLCGSAGIDAYVGKGLDGKPGFAMTNAAGVMSITIAEHCVAMMLAVVRQFPQMVRQQVQKHYARRWHGGEVTGTTACIVAYGASGGELAKRLVGLGLTVTGVRRQTGPAPGGVARMYSVDAIDTALAEADHVFCLLPGGEPTRHFFNADRFSQMKRGSFFYNASRGSVADQAALIESLKSGHLAGAGLDVFDPEPLETESPLWELPNVLITHHSAGHSAMLAGRLARLFANNLQNLRAGRPLENQVALKSLR